MYLYLQLDAVINQQTELAGRSEHTESSCWESRQLPWVDVFV